MAPLRGASVVLFPYVRILRLCRQEAPACPLAYTCCSQLTHLSTSMRSRSAGKFVEHAAAIADLCDRDFTLHEAYGFGSQPAIKASAGPEGWMHPTLHTPETFCIAAGR